MRSKASEDDYLHIGIKCVRVLDNENGQETNHQVGAVARARGADLWSAAPGYKAAMKVLRCFLFAEQADAQGLADLLGMTSATDIVTDPSASSRESHLHRLK